MSAVPNQPPQPDRQTAQRDRPLVSVSRDRVVHWYDKQGWLKKIVESKTVQELWKQQFVQGILKGLGIGAVVFLTFAVASLIPVGGRTTNSTGKYPQLESKLARLKTNIQEVQETTDPLRKELLIQQQAKDLDLGVGDYKKMLALRQPGIAPLPDAPTGVLEKVSWFYNDLSRSQRFWMMWGWAGSGILGLVGLGSQLTFVVVGIKYLQEIPQREKQAEDQKRLARYQAWQVIHAAHGQRVSGARIAALEDLVQQGESLIGLILEKGADLGGIQLKGARLIKANLQDAYLKNANLQDALLKNANFQGAYLRKVNLQGSDLRGANLRGACFADANLTETRGLTEDQLKDTYLCRTKLPDHLKHLSDRNCKEDRREWMNKWRTILAQQQQASQPTPKSSAQEPSQPQPESSPTTSEATPESPEPLPTEDSQQA